MAAATNAALAEPSPDADRRRCARPRAWSRCSAFWSWPSLISPTASDGSRIFLQAGNLTDILRQISLIGIISLAMTFVILTGGIDLSVGSILALSTALVGDVPDARATRTHIAVAILAAVAASAAVGRAERRGDRAHCGSSRSS